MKHIYILTLSLLYSFALLAQVQIGKDINGRRVGDQSGSSVSISSDGSIIAIGARKNQELTDEFTYAGYVRVYRRQPPDINDNNRVWIKIGQVIYGEAQKDRSGIVSLSSDGKILAIGAPLNDGNGEDNVGHVRVFQIQPDTLIQIGQDIDGESEFDESGTSVSLSSNGSIIAIGAPKNDGNGENRGHVRIYQNISGKWIQIGNDIDGEEDFDESGYSVSLSSDGKTIAIGAPRNNGNGPLCGHVRIYQNISEKWIQIGQDIDGDTITKSNINAGFQFGWSVSLSGDGSIVAVGAPLSWGKLDTDRIIGLVRVYKNQSGSWIQVGQDIYGDAGKAGVFGYSVSLSSDGSLFAAGAIQNADNGILSGEVKLYENQSGIWTQVGQDINGEDSNDDSGYCVSLSSDGSLLAIGALGNRGSVRVFSTEMINVGSPELKNEFRIYPNPTFDKLNFQIQPNILGSEFRIINALGQEIMKGKLSNLCSNIDVSKLSKGSYIIFIETGNYSHKFLIK